LWQAVSGWLHAAVAGNELLPSPFSPFVSVHETVLPQAYRAFPDIPPSVLDPSFWIGRLTDPHRVLMSEGQIAQFNRANSAHGKSLEDIWNVAETIPREDLISLITEVSRPRAAYRYDERGKRLTRKDIEAFAANIDMKSLPERVTVQYGMTLRRTVMRAYPTNKKALKEKGALSFDHLITSAVYAAEPMQILAKSLDHQWLFVQTATVRGWVPAMDVAYGNKQDVLDYARREPFVVVTSPFVLVPLIDRQGEANAHIRLDMGIRLPLADDPGLRREHYVTAALPLMNKEGQLSFAGRAHIPLADVHHGYLPYTRANIIRQAFLLHGEPYGWGGSKNARDCSAFLSDIYRTFGIILPRNTDDQAFESLGLTYNFSKLASTDERLRLLDSLSVHTPFPLYKPGHAMLYLGSYEGKHYVIHDAAGFYTLNASGRPVRKRIMQVIISPMESMRESDGTLFPDHIHTARDFVYVAAGTP